MFRLKRLVTSWTSVSLIALEDADGLYQANYAGKYTILGQKSQLDNNIV